MFRKKGIIIVLVGLGILTSSFWGVEPVHASNQDRINKALKIVENRLENLTGNMKMRGPRGNPISRKDYYGKMLKEIKVSMREKIFFKKRRALKWTVFGEMKKTRSGFLNFFVNIINKVSDGLARDSYTDDRREVSKSKGTNIYINKWLDDDEDYSAKEIAGAILWEMVKIAQRKGAEYKGKYFFVENAKRFPMGGDINSTRHFTQSGLLHQSSLSPSAPYPIWRKIDRSIGFGGVIEYPKGNPASWTYRGSKKFEVKKINGKWVKREVIDGKRKAEWKGMETRGFFDLFPPPPEWLSFGIVPSYFYSLVDMSEVNDYINWINNTWGGDIPKIDRADGFSMKGIYRTSPHTGFSLGGESFRIETSGISAPPLKFKLGSSVWGVVPGFFSEYPDVIGKLDLGIDIQIGYYWADYVEEEDGWRQDGSDSSIGYKIAAKAEYPLTENFHIRGDIGYRILKMDDFGVNFVSPGNPPVELDYSGWFAEIGISYNW